MRLTVIALAVACAACAASAASTAPGNPPASIAGSWSSWAPGQAPDPGGPEIITLTESDTTVSGSDSFGVRTSTVSGQYVRPNIALTIALPNYAVVHYNGRALDANRISLNGVVFYRQ